MLSVSGIPPPPHLRLHVYFPSFCISPSLLVGSSGFKVTVNELQVKVNELKEIIAHMESVHYGSTAGSLAGGVFGAAGGIKAIDRLILAPFTLAAFGGVTGAASNITNMVKQSADRNSIQAILNECQEKMDLSVTCLQNISDGINTANEARSIDSEGLPPIEGRTNQALVRAGKGLAGVGELVRLIQVVSIGKVAAQVAKTVRVAEAATGVLAGLFVALDIYFIAQDSREIHAMRQESTESPHESDASPHSVRQPSLIHQSVLPYHRLLPPCDVTSSHLGQSILAPSHPCPYTPCLHLCLELTLILAPASLLEKLFIHLHSPARISSPLQAHRKVASTTFHFSPERERDRVMVTQRERERWEVGHGSSTGGPRATSGSAKLPIWPTEY
ncbi:hypothetical protein JZ751_003411 [Albula glossodonta]|uniref:Apolipoprotein L3 n=1 Tax=Albula glossodonta TaxID=121402 RepID=A0A8T2MPV8_9TELE|nr:hypothetical protein JZ751_003411 [Albula glossodonta]